MAKKDNGNDISGLAFVGCMFVGIGLGVVFDQPGAGTLLGLGVGFVAMAIIKKKSRA